MQVKNVFAICKSSIKHLACPSIKHLLYTFVFHIFSWVLQSSQDKLKTMLMHGGQTRCTVVYVQIMNDTAIRIKTTCCCCCWCSNKKQSISSGMKISDMVALCIWGCMERINLQVIFYFFNCLIHVGELNSRTSKLHVVTCRFFPFIKHEWNMPF